MNYSDNTKPMQTMKLVKPIKRKFKSVYTGRCHSQDKDNGIEHDNYLIGDQCHNLKYNI